MQDASEGVWILPAQQTRFRGRSRPITAATMAMATPVAANSGPVVRAWLGYVTDISFGAG